MQNNGNMGISDETMEKHWKATEAYGSVMISWIRVELCIKRVISLLSEDECFCERMERDGKDRPSAKALIDEFGKCAREAHGEFVHKCNSAIEDLEKAPSRHTGTHLEAYVDMSFDELIKNAHIARVQRNVLAHDIAKKEEEVLFQARLIDTLDNASSQVAEKLWDEIETCMESIDKVVDIIVNVAVLTHRRKSMKKGD